MKELGDSEDFRKMQAMAACFLALLYCQTGQEKEAGDEDRQFEQHAFSFIKKGCPPDGEDQLSE